MNEVCRIISLQQITNYKILYVIYVLGNTGMPFQNFTGLYIFPITTIKENPDSKSFSKGQKRFSMTQHLSVRAASTSFSIHLQLLLSNGLQNDRLCKHT